MEATVRSYFWKIGLSFLLGLVVIRYAAGGDLPSSGPTVFFSTVTKINRGVTPGNPIILANPGEVVPLATWVHVPSGLEIVGLGLSVDVSGGTARALSLMTLSRRGRWERSSLNDGIQETRGNSAERLD